MNRLKLASWFTPRGEPSRQPRVSKLAPEAPEPTIDERTAFAAQELLENHALERVFDRLRKQAFHDITNSRPGAEGLASREASYLKTKVLDEIHTSIRAMADELKFHRARDSE